MLTLEEMRAFAALAARDLAETEERLRPYREGDDGLPETGRFLERRRRRLEELRTALTQLMFTTYRVDR